MDIKYESNFDSFSNDDKSSVFQIIPNCYNDNRGYFMEVIKDLGEWPNNKIPLWFSNTEWIRQINRSSSNNGVIRGCHAQKGLFCQGKLVGAVNEKIYDIITDARPNSKTFGVSAIFTLSPITHNLLWVPRGFLHSFVVPFSSKENAIFEYFCDNTYNKESEIGVNPESILPKVVYKFHEIMGDTCYDEFKDLYDVFSDDKKNVYSEKDIKAQDYEKFIISIKDDYEKTGKLWYR